MIKVLSNNYFCVQRDGRVDVYTLGQRCEVVKCVTTVSPREAILWVSRKERNG